ncbi:hypothetical protein [Promicromonospora sukumoe]
MRTELVIIDSARKRGYVDDDLLHVIANAIRVIVQSDGMTMYVGPDRAGRIMEVGTIERSGREIVAHAMRPARPKYLAEQPRRSRR